MKKIFLAAMCMMAIGTARAGNEPALKDVFKNDFLIGAALNESQFSGGDEGNCETALIKKHFNTITPENVLKWQSVHPGVNRYDFEAADRYVDFGVKNGMFIIGHNLVWHNQTPPWVFKGKDGNPITREALLQRMHDHIFAVVGRYKGKIKGWDVVNEAVEDDGTLRPTPWYNVIGEDYLLKAYQFAHEADPEAQLYYNDFSMENAPKRAGVVALIKKLRAQGAAISGIGIQGHYKLDWPAPSDLEQTIDAFASLGLKVMITELDIDVLPPATSSVAAEAGQQYELHAGQNPYGNGLPETMQRALATRYANLFRIFVKHRKQISRVTFWGVTDGDSWLNNWPVRGRTDYPLLFDRNCGIKPAFAAVVATAQ